MISNGWGCWPICLWIYNMFLFWNVLQLLEFCRIYASLTGESTCLKLHASYYRFKSNWLDRSWRDSHLSLWGLTAYVIKVNPNCEDKRTALQGPKRVPTIQQSLMLSTLDISKAPPVYKDIQKWITSIKIVAFLTVSWVHSEEPS